MLNTEPISISPGRNWLNSSNHRKLANAKRLLLSTECLSMCCTYWCLLLALLAFLLSLVLSFFWTGLASILWLPSCVNTPRYFFVEIVARLCNTVLGSISGSNLSSGSSTSCGNCHTPTFTHLHDPYQWNEIKTAVDGQTAAWFL